MDAASGAPQLITLFKGLSFQEKPDTDTPQAKEEKKKDGKEKQALSFKNLNPPALVMASIQNGQNDKEFTGQLTGLAPIAAQGDGKKFEGLLPAETIEGLDRLKGTPSVMSIGAVTKKTDGVLVTNIGISGKIGPEKQAWLESLKYVSPREMKQLDRQLGLGDNKDGSQTLYKGMTVITSDIIAKIDARKGSGGIIAFFLYRKEYDF